MSTSIQNHLPNDKKQGFIALQRYVAAPLITIYDYSLSCSGEFYLYYIFCPFISHSASLWHTQVFVHQPLRLHHRRISFPRMRLVSLDIWLSCVSMIENLLAYKQVRWSASPCAFSLRYIDRDKAIVDAVIAGAAEEAPPVLAVTTPVKFQINYPIVAHPFGLFVTQFTTLSSDLQSRPWLTPCDLLIYGISVSLYLSLGCFKPMNFFLSCRLIISMMTMFN